MRVSSVTAVVCLLAALVVSGCRKSNPHPGEHVGYLATPVEQQTAVQRRIQEVEADQNMDPKVKAMALQNLRASAAELQGQSGAQSGPKQSDDEQK